MATLAVAEQLPLAHLILASSGLLEGVGEVHAYRALGCAKPHQIPWIKDEILVAEHIAPFTHNDMWVSCRK